MTHHRHDEHRHAGARCREERSSSSKCSMTLLPDLPIHAFPSCHGERDHRFRLDAGAHRGERQGILFRRLVQPKRLDAAARTVCRSQPGADEVRLERSAADADGREQMVRSAAAACCALSAEADSAARVAGEARRGVALLRRAVSLRRDPAVLERPARRLPQSLRLSPVRLVVERRDALLERARPRAC